MDDNEIIERFQPCAYTDSRNTTLMRNAETKVMLRSALKGFSPMLLMRHAFPMSTVGATRKILHHSMGFNRDTLIYCSLTFP